MIIIFCGNNHYSDRCSIVTDLDVRKSILRKKRRCYRCLRANHMAKFCSVSVKFYKCKMVGDNHTAFCCRNESYRTSKDRNTEATDEFTTTCLINENKSVLFQTAMCNLIGNNDRTISVKALFDSGSQQTYIANHLAKILNLKPLREVNMLVQTFGSNAKNLNAQEYEIKIHSCTGDIIPLHAIAVPKICDKIAGEIVKKAVKRHPFMQNLHLADDGSNPDVSIELLLGANIY